MGEARRPRLLYLPHLPLPLLQPHLLRRFLSPLPRHQLQPQLLRPRRLRQSTCRHHLQLRPRCTLLPLRRVLGSPSPPSPSLLSRFLVSLFLILTTRVGVLRPQQQAVMVALPPRSPGLLLLPHLRLLLPSLRHRVERVVTVPPVPPSISALSVLNAVFSWKTSRSGNLGEGWTTFLQLLMLMVAHTVPAVAS